MSPPSACTSPETARRERILLLVAAAFVVVGAVALQLSPTAGVGIERWALIVCAFVAAFAIAHLFLNRHLPGRDPLLLPVAAFLTGWGLLLIGRLAANFLLRQAVWLLLSATALLAVVWLGRDLRWLRRFRYTWLLGGLALLAVTLIFGVNPSGYGPRLWLGIFGVYFQPSELLKLLMIVYLASYLAERRGLLVSEGHQVGPWRLPPLAYVGPLVAMFGLTVVLLAWQQDLGAAMLFFFTFLAMLYLATGQARYVTAGLVLFAVIGLAGYLLSDRVALRVDGWLDPWQEAAGRTFQIVQSLLAFAAGGLFGQGLGQGSPTYIPAVHTDFAFAAVGEEFGLVGVLAVIALYGLLLARGFRAAASARPAFQRFLAAGLTAGTVIQAWVIMAGNAKLAPIAGVTLPFVSYGGSSLLISFIALGLLLRISSVDQESGSGRNHDTAIRTDDPVGAAMPLHQLAGALALALILLTITCGYWAIARADSLRARDDNPRRVLYEQRIVRGRILDREGVVLADAEIAADGTVTRRYPVPQAAPAVGYASLRYGTGGIEAAFDAELRGEAQSSDWQAAWDRLLHRPPQGRDVQLTLDAALQAQAQRALAGRAGAVVLLEVESGQVLALASNPTFDPGELDERWDSLREDPAAPLLNRATQGLYQPGAALQTAVLAEQLIDDEAILAARAPHITATLTLDGTPLGCSRPPAEPYTLASAYAAACPGPFAELGEQLSADGLQEAVDRWVLATPPPLEIPTEAAGWDSALLTTTAALRSEAIGQGNLTVSPLQMALVAGTLAAGGEMPAPRLVLGVQDTEGAWRETAPPAEPRAVLPPDIARELLASWQRHETDSALHFHWGIAVAGEEQQPHAWFLAVAPEGAPRHAIAVLLEHAATPEAAIEVGTTLLDAASSEPQGRSLRGRPLRAQTLTQLSGRPGQVRVLLLHQFPLLHLE